MKDDALLTAGAVGIVAEIAFNHEWDGLTKTLICNAGDIYVPMLIMADGKARIPPECMIEGEDLRIGVDGWDLNGGLRIPTRWARVGRVLPSVDGADMSERRPEPTPDIVTQIQFLAEHAEEIAAGVREDADNHVFDGFSPSISVSRIEGGHKVTVTNADGQNTFDVLDGAVSEEEMQKIAKDAAEILQPGIDEKAVLYKLFFDGTDVYQTYEDKDAGKEPMTFSGIYALCAQKENVVYVGDGEKTYYPHFDPNIPAAQVDSIAFATNGTQDGANYHTRIIINSQNLISTETITDAPIGYVDEIEEYLSHCLKEPENMVVGRYFRIAAIDEKGHAVLEAVDAPTGGVTDVQIAGTSVVQDGLANIQYATNTMQGLVRTGNANPLIVDANGQIGFRKNNNNISNRSADGAYGNLIGSWNFDYAVKVAMTDGKGAAWTAEEQAAAQQRLGILSVEEVLFG